MSNINTMKWLRSKNGEYSTSDALEKYYWSTIEVLLKY